jgi:quercetin dioxygenase-like cupin family protein
MYREEFYNPVTGETLSVLESSKNVSRFEFTLPAGTQIASERIYPTQDHTIFVLEGRLGCRIGAVKHILGVGASRRIPASTPHFLWNASDKNVRAIAEFNPAGRIRCMFRVAYSMARYGYVGWNGQPKLLIGAAFFSEFKDVVEPSSIGSRILYGLMNPLSRLLGYRRKIKGYMELYELEDLDRTLDMPFSKPASDPAPRTHEESILNSRRKIVCSS